MTFIKCYTFKNNVHLCILFQTLNYLQYFVCVSPHYCMTLFVILIHHALPVINIVTLWQLVHLSPCSYLKKGSAWALVQTENLIGLADLS